MVLFIILLHMNCAENCENLLNFVRVMPKVLLVPFFSRHGVYINYITVLTKNETKPDFRIRKLKTIEL